MISVYYGQGAPSKEISAAEKLERRVESVSSQNSQTISRFFYADFSIDDAVIIVGGQDINQQFKQLSDAGKVQRIDGRGEEVNKIVDVEGTPVLVIAGFKVEDTLNLIDEALKNGQVSRLISRIEDDEDPINEDPIDLPIIDDPVEDPQPPETPHTLEVKPPQRFEFVFSADYVIETTGVVKEDSDLERGDTAVNTRATGSVGASLGVDSDKFKFSGKIAEVKSDKAIILVINGETYQYDPDVDKIGKPSDLLGVIGGTEQSDRIKKDKQKKGGNTGNGEDKDPSKLLLGDTKIIIAVVIFVLVYFLTNRGSPDVVVND